MSGWIRVGQPCIWLAGWFGPRGAIFRPFLPFWTISRPFFGSPGPFRGIFSPPKPSRAQNPVHPTRINAKNCLQPRNQEFFSRKTGNTQENRIEPPTLVRLRILPFGGVFRCFQAISDRFEGISDRFSAPGASPSPLQTRSLVMPPPVATLAPPRRQIFTTCQFRTRPLPFRPESRLFSV